MKVDLQRLKALRGELDGIRETEAQLDAIMLRWSRC